MSALIYEVDRQGCSDPTVSGPFALPVEVLPLPGDDVLVARETTRLPFENWIWLVVRQKIEYLVRL